MLRMMRFLKAIPALVLASFVVVALPALGGPISSCNADSTVCSIYEDGTFFQPGFLFIAGDVVLTDPSGAISDVLRFFNDFVDTGSGTGLGFTMFLYSDDEVNLPDPRTFSANAVFLTEGPSIVNGLIETDYFNDGTLYQIFSSPEFSSVPEPASLQLLGIAVGFMGVMMRGRRRRVDARTSATSCQI
jgi:hypothetical protein